MYVLFFHEGINRRSDLSHVQWINEARVFRWSAGSCTRQNGKRKKGKTNDFYFFKRNEKPIIANQPCPIFFMSLPRPSGKREIIWRNCFVNSRSLNCVFLSLKKKYQTHEKKRTNGHFFFVIPSENFSFDNIGRKIVFSHNGKLLVRSIK